MSTDVTKAKIALPIYNTDKVVFAFSYSTQINNVVGTYTSSFDYSSNATATNGMISFGIYSIDGGTTWNDFQSTDVVIQGQSVQVSASDSQGVITFTVRVNSTVGGGGTFPLMLSFGVIDCSGTQTTLLNPTNEFTQKAAYDSRTPSPIRFDNQTVAYDGTLHSVSHNLGYIPDARYYILNTSVHSNAGGTNLLDGPNTGYEVTSTTMNINSVNSVSNQSVGYVIYYRNN